MYKNTVTVFNRKPGDREKGATWYPTIIKNCNLNVDRAAILANEDSITFSPTGDFFWNGEWDGGIVADSDERWTDEGFYAYMNRTKDNVFTISSVSRHSVIPLIEVWGK